MLSIGKIALDQHRYYEQQVAEGRLDHHVTDPREPLGPEPTCGGNHRRDWQRTRDMIDRTQRNLGLDRPYARDLGLDIGR